MQQFKFLQVNNLFLTPEVALTVELVSHVFNLSMDGETKFDRALSKLLKENLGSLITQEIFMLLRKSGIQIEEHKWNGFLRMFCC